MDKKYTFEIDNITWNDLSLESIYSRLNSCITTAGDDYFRYCIKNPYIKNCDDYESRVDLFEESACFNNYEPLIKAFQYISKLTKYNFIDEINSFNDTESNSNVKHYIIDILLIISFFLIFVVPGPGIVLFFAMIAYAVSDYFKTKNIISGHLAVFNYLIRIIKSTSKYKVELVSTTTEFNIRINRLKEIAVIFRPFIKGTYVISEGAKTTSNPFSILFDYIRMIFHVDIIKYNSMISFIVKNKALAIECYRIIGELDTALCVNKVKNEYVSKGLKLCKPNFCDEKRIMIKDGYHLMIEHPVCNTIDSNKNILITGCNASGKSTFLKLVALNALFAQSLGFVFADEYKASFYRIYSSMALSDDIDKGESYFMAEIKSLKRIVDASTCEQDESESVPVLCVIDEVLRGTNTVERIAASVEILLGLSKNNVMCITATHDIELTELLKDNYENHHFSEEIDENDVKFNYLINKGPAKSRNAIRLLNVLGYSEDIVENAGRRADEFLNTGVWTV